MKVRFGKRVRVAKGVGVNFSTSGASLSLGAFINDFINFVVLAFVIYLVIKLLKLDVKK